MTNAITAIRISSNSNNEKNRLCFSSLLLLTTITTVVKSVEHTIVIAKIL